MGANYYALCNICSQCGRYDELHICKLSLGWKPLFQAYREKEHGIEIRSFQDWVKFLEHPDVKIVDGYGNEIEKRGFIKLLKRRHDDEDFKSHLKDDWVWVDKEGYEFTYREFG